VDCSKYHPDDPNSPRNRHIPSSLEEALKKGYNFFNSKPCRRGHVRRRIAKAKRCKSGFTSYCIQCVRDAKAKKKGWDSSITSYTKIIFNYE